MGRLSVLRALAICALACGTAAPTRAGEALSAQLAQSVIGGVRNYDECIIVNMRGTTSDVAARAIEQACRNLFPPTRPVSPVPQPGVSWGNPSPKPPAGPGHTNAPRQDHVLDRVNGTAVKRLSLARGYTVLDRGSFQSVTIYVTNGNDDWHVSELVLEIRDGPDGRRKSEVVARVSLPPLQGGEAVIDLPNGSLAQTRFEIVGARGYR